MEVYRASEGGEYVQDSFVWNEKRGTLRGMHEGPQRLLTVLSGGIRDVIVGVSDQEMTRGDQVLIPAGSLHGYVTLTDGVCLLYKSTEYFKPYRRVNPLSLGIDWGFVLVMSEADRNS